MERETGSCRVFSIVVTVAILLFVAGCGVVSKPIIGQKRDDFLVRARGSVELAYFDAKELGTKIRTTPVHPEDAGFLRGQTTTDLISEFVALPKAGLIGFLGDESLRLTASIDLRLNRFSDPGYKEGLYDRKKQVSDIRPPFSGSFVYTQIVPGYFTYIPSVGIEGNIDWLMLGFELGFPYTNWEVESGHDRWGKWEKVQSDSWSGFGRRYTGTVGAQVDESVILFLSGFYEQYQPTFLGESAKFDIIGGFGGVMLKF